MSYPQQGSGLPIGRLVIGAIIALAAVIGYFSHTSVNPVTGEKQHITLTADQERALGLQAAPQMAAEMGGEVNSADPRAAEVSKVGHYVVDHSDAHNGGYTYDFHLLRDTQTVNAFALPGGQVFITLGLYDKLPDEAALAGVLGHETGHVIGRHAAEQMAKGQLGNQLVMATGVAGSADNRGQLAAMAAAMANQMLQLKFSRHDESEADGFGLQFMAQAGYDPHAMLDVMTILEKLSAGGRQPEFLQTHPYPEARHAAVDAYLKAHPNASGARGDPLPK